MPNFNRWLVPTKITGIDAEGRAVAAWKRIQDRPTEITLRRKANNSATTTLDPQTFRVEFDDVQNDIQGVGKTSERMIVLFGVHGHPTIEDSDIQTDDRFKLDGVNYEVRDVVRLPGEVQAKARRVS